MTLNEAQLRMKENFKTGCKKGVEGFLLIATELEKDEPDYETIGSVVLGLERIIVLSAATCLRLQEVSK